MGRFLHWLATLAAALQVLVWILALVGAVWILCLLP